MKVPALPSVGTSKDKGLIKRKRTLQGPPALKGAAAVGAAGKGIRGFFKRDTQHHKDAFRPGLGLMAAKTSGTVADEIQAQQVLDRGRVALQSVGLAAGLQPPVGS